ncbi:MAG TPA: hypothetical protein PKG54_02905 [Phycisphaerae bacterium]|jgi:hypothetical protein|nr:hypothetical protein [Phycisphaerae bacterium]HOB73453.1 hypothetical protein [Phycisphaerae bacterium]HOJ55980.1 hypothetical protein [Phycisphaerae bacterium]HOL25646.1 hypothetical protein [Phycisphaerae bacterium]HPP22108.1 hypothetical protein [Phycisphaerae bacterium]
MSDPDILRRTRGTLLGQAIDDVLGTTVRAFGGRGVAEDMRTRASRDSQANALLPPGYSYRPFGLRKTRKV